MKLVPLLLMSGVAACAAADTPSTRYALKIDWPAVAPAPHVKLPDGELVVMPLRKGDVSPYGGLLFNDLAHAYSGLMLDVARADAKALRASRGIDRDLADDVLAEAYTDLAQQADEASERSESLARQRDVVVGVAIVEAIVIGVTIALR